MPPPADPARTKTLLEALSAYRPARERLIGALGLPESNRDPLAEFSEHLVAAIMGGSLASGRVQAGWDLELADGALAQVRYLANPRDRWVNEHSVRRIPGVTWYVLVLFEAFQVAGILAFPNRLGLIGVALKKRHPEQDHRLE